jgi:hypothetical protein
VQGRTSTKNFRIGGGDVVHLLHLSPHPYFFKRLPSGPARGCATRRTRAPLTQRSGTAQLTGVKKGVFLREVIHNGVARTSLLCLLLNHHSRLNRQGILSGSFGGWTVCSPLGGWHENERGQHLHKELNIIIQHRREQ